MLHINVSVEDHLVQVNKARRYSQVPSMSPFDAPECPEIGGDREWGPQLFVNFFWVLPMLSVVILVLFLC